MNAFFAASAAGRRSHEEEVPEADQQVRAQAHQLPGNVQQKEAVRQHQRQHGAGEERHDGEEPAKARVAAHV
ncbi:MAG: hypothetical protein C4289_04725 [Chloroflexota bacterium]